MNTSNITDAEFFGFDRRLIQAAIRRAGLPVNQETCSLAKDAVADAMIKYQPNRDGGKVLTLKSWVYTYVRWQIRRYLNPPKKQVATVSLEEPIANGKSGAEDTCLADVVPSQTNVETSAINNIMFEQLRAAISKMDKKGQFIMNFIIEAANPLRCGNDLGKALAENGLVKSRGENKRERARQLMNKYLGEAREILASMGIEKVSDIYEEIG